MICSEVFNTDFLVHEEVVEIVPCVDVKHVIIKGRNKFGGREGGRGRCDEKVKWQCSESGVPVWQ